MIRHLFLFIFSISLLPPFVFSQETESDGNLKREEPVEIQVIRPRFFSKIHRLEFGAQGVLVANQPFVYTYMASGIAAYHLNEYVGFEANFEYGISSDKEEKTILTSDFDIKTEIDRIQSMTLVGLTLTPIYGKYQLGEGRLLYFDTFFTVGGGLTGIDYHYDHCTVSSTYTAPDPRVVQYPTIYAGLGQRYFVGTSGSIRYDIRTHFFSKNAADGSCDANATDASTTVSQVVTMQVGYSYYF